MIDVVAAVVALMLVVYFVGQLIRWRATDCPPEIDVCEYDCDRVDCTAEQWRACERRKRLV